MESDIKNKSMDAKTKLKNDRNQRKTKYICYLIGNVFDLLINSNLKNWHGKESLFSDESPFDRINQEVYEAFQANKIRNKMITKIDRLLLKGPKFHFRNYNDY